MAYETEPGKRPGWQTTEFWLSVLGLVFGFVLVLAGNAETGKWLIGLSVAGYGLSRGIAKAGGGA